MSRNTLLKWGVLLPLAGSLLLSGCMGQSKAETYPLVSQPMVQKKVQDIGGVAYAHADAMIENLGNRLPQRHLILPTSFVDQNDLATTSALGRRLAIQMASRFTQRGFSVLEIKLRNNIFIREGGGEFMLSRNLENINQNHNVKSALVGSYAVSQNRIEVHAQLIRIKDQVALTSTDFALPLNSNTRALLKIP